MVDGGLRVRHGNAVIKVEQPEVIRAHHATGQTRTCGRIIGAPEAGAGIEMMLRQPVEQHAHGIAGARLLLKITRVLQ